MLKEPTCSERGCKHFLGLKRHDGPETEDEVICEAFPEGIPEEIEDVEKIISAGDR